MLYDDNNPLTARPGELTPIPWYCEQCGEENETLLDLEGGYDQVYVEDCAVCCRPNVIRIHVDPGSLEVWLQNELE